LQVYQTENHHHEMIMRPDGNTEERHYRWVTGMDFSSSVTSPRLTQPISLLRLDLATDF
jgi:hypothetical protein